MKRHLSIVLAFSLAFGLPVFAEETVQEKCTVIGQLAEEIMRGRQNGQIMSTAMASMPADNPFTPLAHILIRQAYGKPQFQTEEVKANAIVDFRNQTELACYNTEWK